LLGTLPAFYFYFFQINGNLVIILDLFLISIFGFSALTNILILNNLIVGLFAKTNLLIFENR
jgi:hypothetical protein